MKFVGVLFTLLICSDVIASASTVAARRAREFNELCAMIPECAERKRQEQDYRKNYWKYYYARPVVETKKRSPIPEAKQMQENLNKVKIIK